MNIPVPVDYDPKCSLYKREQTSGQIQWYLNYYLPNKKRIRRPVSGPAKEAKQKMKVKERQLLIGRFDAYDCERMAELFKKEKGLLIQNATSDYLAKTATNKTLKTQEVDRSCVQCTFQYFTQAGLTSVDEIKIKHVQDMIDSLIADQYSLSSIRNAVTAVKKVFVWLIEIQEAELKNPVLIKKTPLSRRLCSARSPTFRRRAMCFAESLILASSC